LGLTTRPQSRNEVLGQLGCGLRLRPPHPNHQSEKDIGENIEGKHEGDALSRKEKSGERRSEHPGTIEADRSELCSGPRFAGWRKLRGQGLIGRVRGLRSSRV